MTDDIYANLFIFLLSGFLGFELIKKVSPLLHTPLMSLTNALSAVSLVGAIVVSGTQSNLPFVEVIALIAVLAATLNAVSGFMITDRMLKMFKTTKKEVRK